MATRVLLKRIHLVATAWFVACAGYLVGAGLRQVGFNWWAVLSLSGYSTGMLLILVSLYLFALYRGVGGIRRTEAEHPLTSATWYMGLYVSAPLLAALVAATGTEAVPGTSGHLIRVAMGTLKATFLVWIVIDPLMGVIEMDLPASRAHRTERLARMKDYDRLSEKTKPGNCGALGRL